ncbi:MAG: tetratricopeptide repeat protein [Candidatus Obscuribacterales bacterium]|nr:tetratricopeptide repeat protein [Candidatus Obscuribacterales bacterium]
MRTAGTCTKEGIELYKNCQFIEAEQTFVESVRRARNEDLSSVELARCLSNLALVYIFRAKFHDADTILREVLSLTASDTSVSLEYLFALYLRANLYVEQEYYDQAKRDLKHALQLLGHEHEFCAAEFWFKLAASYLGTGEIEKANSAIDSFSIASKKCIQESNRINLDEATGIAIFAHDWQQDGSICEKTASTVAAVRELLIRAKTMMLNPLQAKTLALEAMELGQTLGDHCYLAAAYSVATKIALTMTDLGHATRCCKKGLELYSRVLGDTHPALITHLAMSARLTLFTKSLPPCEVLMQQLEQIVEKNFGSAHPTYAQYQLLRANILPFFQPAGLDLREQKQKLIQEAFQTLQNSLDNHHSQVINCKVTLADLLMQNGETEQAALLLREALTDTVDSDKITASYNIFMIVNSMLVLANIRRENEQQEIVALTEQTVSNIDESIASVEQLIHLKRQKADFFKKIGKFTEAEEQSLEALRISKSTDAHVHYRCIEDLTQLEFESGQAEKAYNNLSQASITCHTDKLRANSQMAYILNALDKKEESESLAMETLTEAKQILPDGAEPFVRCFSLLMDIYLSQDRLDEAVRIVGLYSDYSEYIGPASRDVIPISLRFLADAHAQKKDMRAEELYLQATARAEEARGASPHVLDDCLVSYSDYCRMSGQFDRARKLLERWLELRIRVNGAESFATGVAMINLAELSAEVEPNKALDLSKRAIEIIETEALDDKHFYCESLRIRAYILEKSNFIDEARELIEKANKTAATEEVDT